MPVVALAHAGGGSCVPAVVLARVGGDAWACWQWHLCVSLEPAGGDVAHAGGGAWVCRRWRLCLPVVATALIGGGAFAFRLLLPFLLAVALTHCQQWRAVSLACDDGGACVCAGSGACRCRRWCLSLPVVALVHAGGGAWVCQRWSLCLAAIAAAPIGGGAFAFRLLLLCLSVVALARAGGGAGACTFAWHMETLTQLYTAHAHAWVHVPVAEGRWDLGAECLPLRLVTVRAWHGAMYELRRGDGALMGWPERHTHTCHIHAKYEHAAYLQ